MKKLTDWILRYLPNPDHEQRKMLGTIAHGQALLILAHYFIYGKGFSAVIVLFVAIALWVFAYKIVRKDEEEK
jgi:hypothetical protein